MTHLTGHNYNDRNDPTLRESKDFKRPSAISIVIRVFLSFFVAWLLANIFINLFEILFFSVGGGGANITAIPFKMLKAIFHVGSYLNNSHTISGHGAAVIAGNKLLGSFNIARNILFVIFVLMFLNHYVRKVLVPINMNHNEHGDDQLALPKQVKKETVAVPDRNTFFKGRVGAIVMHEMNSRGLMNQEVKTRLPALVKSLGINNIHNNIKKNIIYIFLANIAIILLILVIIYFKFIA